jgi:UDP-glucose 4-epimerase
MAAADAQAWTRRLRETFAGRKALVLGGMGFIGSSLATRLVELGADVLIADAMIDGYGGNTFNIAAVSGKVRVNFCDIRDPNAINYLVLGQDFVFHSAAQVCHIMSLRDPFPDIDINIKGTAVLMEALRQHNPGATVVKLGSRGQYGPVSRLPAREDERSDPKGIYEISLLAAEHLLSSYRRAHGIPCMLLRLTNIYGPRAQMRHDRFGVANWFVRLALDNMPIPVFGDGLIKRDFLYIDDCVEAILRVAATPEASGQVINVGRDDPSNFLELAQTIVRHVENATWEYRPFSVERKIQEPGDFYSDINKITSLTGWRPSTDLDEGIKATVAYYRSHKRHYWNE